MDANEGVVLADQIQKVVFEAMKTAQGEVIRLFSGEADKHLIAKTCSEANTNATVQIIRFVVAYLESKPSQSEPSVN